MRIKSYRAKSLRDALRLVRDDLGPDAAVLHTREVWDGWLRGLLGQRGIEVTASSGMHVPSRFADETIAARSAQKAGSESRPGPVTISDHFTRVAPVEHGEHRARLRHGLQKSTSDLSSFMQQMMRDESKPTYELPGALFDLYAQLLDAEISEDLAREIIARVRDETSVEQLNDLDFLKQHLTDWLANQIRIHGPIELQSGVRRVVALVGPTGVGKTTTIAKLAANYRLREKRRVGLITVDTYRIAAVEQLRTYADIIDLPMEVVSTPREMRQAVQRLTDLDLVLVDTAGRSPRDEIKIQELKSMLLDANADEVHLVLSATCSARSLTKTASQFASVGTTALVLTKLDETMALGHLLPLVHSTQLPLSYLTNGQNVPDDIQAAEQRRLAESILEFS